MVEPQLQAHCRGPADHATAGTDGFNPGGLEAAKAKALKQRRDLMDKYAHACFSSNMNPNAKVRKHNQKSCNPFDALIGGAFAARPVKRNEFTGVQKVMDAYWTGWKNLESRQVWKCEELTDWHIVRKKAVAKGEEARLGFLFGIMVEKGSEFPEGDTRRYFQNRVVFRRNDVKDPNWDVALFQEMATTPRTLEASCYSDLLASLPGNSVEGRDVQQAYLQAEMEGTPTYVVLPEELWTPEMYEMKRKGGSPVFPCAKGSVRTQKQWCILASLL